MHPIKPVQQFESLDALSKKGTCIEFFSAYQDLDLFRMLQLCHPEGTIEFEPLGSSGSGKIYEAGKAIWSALIDAFPNVDHTVQSQEFDSLSNSVQCHVIIFGTQQKDFAGIKSKGKDFDSDHIFIFKFDDKSLIKKIIVRWDHESFVRQLERDC